MANTPSTMLPLGTPAPPFHLPDYDGRMVSLSDFAAQPLLLVVFMCNHCPFVVHVRSELVALRRDYPKHELAMVGINSNDVLAYPADNAAAMAREAAAAGYDFPYLLDETQEVAKAYRAACTPDFYLFDGERRLAYRGQLDDSRPGNQVPVSGADLRHAIELLQKGLPVPPEQRPSIGCNIKWKRGNEPDYYGRRA